jgi:hypothetical protein
MDAGGLRSSTRPGAIAGNPAPWARSPESEDDPLADAGVGLSCRRAARGSRDYRRAESFALSSACRRPKTWRSVLI